jgi:endonuclease/exonuclease/phosphatase (EEP) superfamily protein YafD
VSGFGFRILTANLANGGADANAFADLVEAAEPDVVAVQELAPDQAEALARVLPLGKLEPARNHDGMGIALRAPGSVRRLRLPYRSAFVAELHWSDDDEPVEVLNVHLAAPHVHPVVQRLWDRRGQVRDVIAHLDATPRRRRVLAGDLNATPLWPAYRRLRERLGDAVEEAARRNGRRAERTWGPWYGSARILRIDHVLVQGLIATDTRVLPIRGSDHSALVADLVLAPG